MTKEQYLTGHMPWEGSEDEKTYVCPVCGAECPEKFYIDAFANCVGCAKCVNEVAYPNGGIPYDRI